MTQESHFMTEPTAFRQPFDKVVVTPRFAAWERSRSGD